MIGEMISSKLVNTPYKFKYYLL